MIQTTAAIIITAIAFIIALRGIFKFFKSPEEIGCSPEKCAGCSKSNGACEPLQDGGIPHKKNMPFPNQK